MPGVWIPMQIDLGTRREVIAIATALPMSADEVIGVLLRFWGWIGNETVDGSIALQNASPAEAMTGLEKALALPVNFLSMLQRSGWLDVTDQGLFVPNFERWLSNGAKMRLQKNARQANWRREADVKRLQSTVYPLLDRPTVDVLTSTDASTTGEERIVQERRGDKKVLDVVDVDDPYKTIEDSEVDWEKAWLDAKRFSGCGMRKDKPKDASLVVKLCVLNQMARIPPSIFEDGVECVTKTKRKNPAAYLTATMKERCQSRGLEFLRLLAAVPEPREPAPIQPGESIPVPTNALTAFGDIPSETSGPK